MEGERFCDREEKFASPLIHKHIKGRGREGAKHTFTASTTSLYKIAVHLPPYQCKPCIFVVPGNFNHVDRFGVDSKF